MSGPKTRGQAIDAFCRECIHDAAAFGTAREQVAACSLTTCPLWRFRPVQSGKSAPDWIRSRDPGDLPDGFHALSQAEAVRAMRADIAATPPGCAVQAHDSTPSTLSAPTQGVTHEHA